MLRLGADADSDSAARRKVRLGPPRFVRFGSGEERMVGLFLQTGATNHRK